MAAFGTWMRDGSDTPVIGAANASALAGGFELLPACDLIVAAEGAKVGLPEVKRGLFAAGGGVFISRRIPLAKALELTLTGDSIDVAEAAALGLVNKVVPVDQLLDEALALAGRIAANGPLVVQATKKLVRAAASLPTPRCAHCRVSSSRSCSGARAPRKVRRPSSRSATRSGRVAESTARGATRTGRERTADRDAFDISKQEALLGVMRSHLAIESPNGQLVQRRSNRMSPPSDLYPCAPGGPNEYVHITAPGDKLFDRLAIAIGRPELVVDERFATHEGRLRHGRELREIVAEWTRVRTKWQAMDELAVNDVPASAVYDSDDLRHDAHLVDRAAMITVEHPDRGGTEVVNNPVRSASLTVDLAAAPRPGEHTAEVLVELLGLTDDEIAVPAESGVIGLAR